MPIARDLRFFRLGAIARKPRVPYGTGRGAFAVQACHARDPRGSRAREADQTCPPASAASGRPCGRRRAGGSCEEISEKGDTPAMYETKRPVFPAAETTETGDRTEPERSKAGPSREIRIALLTIGPRSPPRSASDCGSCSRPHTDAARRNAKPETTGPPRGRSAAACRRRTRICRPSTSTARRLAMPDGWRGGSPLSHDAGRLHSTALPGRRRRGRPGTARAAPRRTAARRSGTEPAGTGTDRRKPAAAAEQAESAPSARTAKERKSAHEELQHRHLGP